MNDVTSTGSSPRIGVDSSEALRPALFLDDTALPAFPKVDVSDEDLVLATVAQRAQQPSVGSIALCATLICGPCEVGRTRVYTAKRDVACLVEAEADRVGWQPTYRSVLKSACYCIHVQLQRLLANL